MLSQGGCITEVTSIATERATQRGRRQNQKHTSSCHIVISCSCLCLCVVAIVVAFVCTQSAKRTRGWRMPPLYTIVFRSNKDALRARVGAAGTFARAHIAQTHLAAARAAHSSKELLPLEPGRVACTRPRHTPNISSTLQPAPMAGGMGTTLRKILQTRIVEETHARPIEPFCAELLLLLLPAGDHLPN